MAFKIISVAGFTVPAGIVQIEETIGTQDFDDGESIPLLFSVVLTDKGRGLLDGIESKTDY
jgi:hypothetical protein